MFAVTGTNPLLEDRHRARAHRARRTTTSSSRKLYPNVDFYSGLFYEALDLPVSMFPVMFAIGRTSGWVAQWLELLDDGDQKIAGPRQIYTGDRTVDYVPIAQRSAS